MTIYNINRETDSGWEKYMNLKSPSSDLFKAIEKKFNDWIDNSNPAGEYEDKYFSEDAIFDKRSAIEEAINGIFETMDEDNLKSISLEDSRLDIESFFQE